MTENTYRAATEWQGNLRRFGYRISEWSKNTNTSHITTWRAIKAGKLKSVDYFGITLIPDSERARIFQP